VLNDLALPLLPLKLDVLCRTVPSPALGIRRRQKLTVVFPRWSPLSCTSLSLPLTSFPVISSITRFGDVRLFLTPRLREPAKTPELSLLSHELPPFRPSPLEAPTVNPWKTLYLSQSASSQPLFFFFQAKLHVRFAGAFPFPPG